MPTIVKHFDKKSGKTRVYESTPHYDPVTKQSRPKRKYLGTLDPETEIVGITFSPFNSGYIYIILQPLQKVNI